jgi:ABC-type uncharacterized transport system ATPase subunit
VIELLGISKRFGALVALDDVSLAIEGGQIHGLLGENGAGKSTVMNVLFGLLRADAGAIRIGGREVTINSPRAARGLGIGMVHQHFKLVPTLTVVENFALSLGFAVSKILPPAKRQLETLRWAVPLDVRVEELSVGQQQRVEITKALLAIEHSGGGRGGGTLILDEPTAVLTPQEAGELFAALDTLKRGGTAIVFISHKLGEVQRICDEVTILRRGKVVMSAPTGTLTAGQMAEKMVGAAIELPHVGRGAAGAPQSALLELHDISAGMLKNASLRVHAGEIVGVAGVDGNGQSDLVQAIVGGMRAARGRVILAGEDATEKPIRWRVDRIANIAEDRHRQAVVLPLTIRDNLLLKDYRRRPYSRAGWLRFSAWRTHSLELVKRFDVRAPSIATTLGRLSGGNQQKVVLARELYDAEKRIVIAVNPTRGLDVGATAFVMNQLLAARERGAGVLLVHSDLDELLAISDRVVVMFNGQLRESAWPKTTKEEIGKLMMGVADTGGRAGGPA